MDKEYTSELKRYIAKFLSVINSGKNTLGSFPVPILALDVIPVSEYMTSENPDDIKLERDILYPEPGSVSSRQAMYLLGKDLCTSPKYDSQRLMVLCILVRNILPPDDEDPDREYVEISLSSVSGHMLTAIAVLDRSDKYEIIDMDISTISGSESNYAGCIMSAWLTSLVMDSKIEKFSSIREQVEKDVFNTVPVRSTYLH
jgi:hypothetical protein